jgi:hypothetical protein
VTGLIQEDEFPLRVIKRSLLVHLVCEEIHSGFCGILNACLALYNNGEDKHTLREVDLHG